MTLTVTGTGSSFSYLANSTVKPFANATINDSESASVTTTITVTDATTGLPTDADGIFPAQSGLTKVSAGVYTYAYSSLSILKWQTGATANTALMSLSVTDTKNQTVTDSHTNVVNALPPSHVLVGDFTTGITRASGGSVYAGPTPGLTYQYNVDANNAPISADNLYLTPLNAGGFIHSGSGFDTIDVSGISGKFALDGGAGYNTLIGNKLGNGNTLFQANNLNATANTWDTIENFHLGDAATVLGAYIPTGGVPYWTNVQSPAGVSGLTLQQSTPQGTTVAVTLAGYSTADLSSGRLAVSIIPEGNGLNTIGILATG